MTISTTTNLASRQLDEITDTEVIGSIRQAVGALPQIELAYEASIKTLWITLLPQPKPVFTYDVVASVHKVQRAVKGLWGAQESLAVSPVRFLAFRGRGPIYTLGGDLDFYLDCLAKGDREALLDYARVSADCIAWNASCLRGSVITLATIHEKAFGGGIDAPRSCNVLIAERRATFCYPEVAFNHFPIAAVGVLGRRVGARCAHQIIDSGEKYSADDFFALGALDAVTPTGEGEAWLRRYARDSLPIHSARLALFCAFHRQAGDLENELAEFAKVWAENLMRLPPIQIAKLQRIVSIQEKMLQSSSAGV